MHHFAKLSFVSEIEEQGVKRTAIEKLIRWKDAPDRKPLIIQGVRQVGKTWLMTRFAEEFFSGRFHYYNFDMDADLCQLFEASHSPQVILEALSFRSGKRIEPESLLIFDEAQSCPEVIHSLKYFCELRPDLRILVAGSLLGLSLARPRSYPVGKVDFMTLEPLSFSEFLMAQQENGLVEFLKSWALLEAVPDIFAKPLEAKLRQYELVGGMPEPAAAWCVDQNLQAAQAAQNRILTAYLQDVESHANALDYPKIKRVWQSLPRQLSRQNNQFRYSIVEARSNARKYGDALQWLIDARIARPVHRVNGLGIPLSGYEEPGAFKIYFVDVGLMSSLARIDARTLLEDNPLFREIKGSLTENLILQSLVAQSGESPHYWASVKPQAEVDFLLEHRGELIPVEVKSSRSINSSSLKTFKDQYGDKIRLRVRFSLKNLSLDGDILNIPLFMADEALRLIDLALERLS